jgi:hypothetical protein
VGVFTYQKKTNRLKQNLRQVTHPYPLYELSKLVGALHRRTRNSPSS